jgi:imidazolonepropionase-like amidohydrolase
VIAGRPPPAGGRCRARHDTIEHGAYFDMDIYDDDYILAEGEKNGMFKESLEKERMMGRKQRETFRAVQKAGVKMLFGTDGA